MWYGGVVRVATPGSEMSLVFVLMSQDRRFYVFPAFMHSGVYQRHACLTIRSCIFTTQRQIHYYHPIIAILKEGRKEGPKAALCGVMPLQPLTICTQDWQTPQVHCVIRHIPLWNVDEPFLVFLEEHKAVTVLILCHIATILR